jgi:hypothetical protein
MISWSRYPVIGGAVIVIYAFGVAYDLVTLSDDHAAPVAIPAVAFGSSASISVSETYFYPVNAITGDEIAVPPRESADLAAHAHKKVRA